SAASGRLRVRAISGSEPRSHHMLKAEAEATARLAPTTPARAGVHSKPGASQAPPAVVSAHIRVTPGLVKATRSRSQRPRERGAAPGIGGASDGGLEIAEVIRAPPGRRADRRGRRSRG